MECIMQQTFYSEGSESYRSSSSLSNNEDQIEFNVNRSSDLESTNGSKQVNTQHPQESNKFINADLDTMMQNYKQLGSELELNLKILENTRLSLNKILVETRHECEILNQQKECQKKNLVDLQIRLENLDTEKINIWKENQKDKVEKTETIKQEMLFVLENDAYINNTYTKFNEILNAEKIRCEDFFNFSKTETELHKNKGESYIKELRKVNSSFKNNYEELLKQETQTIEDLDAALLKYKSIIESSIKLQENISEIKLELEALQNNFDSLNATIFQKKNYLNTLQNNLTNFEDTQNGVVKSIRNEIFDLQARRQKRVQEVNEKNKILTETNKNLQFITNQNATIGEELLNYEVNNKADNQELNRLNEECSSLKCELINLITEQESLEAESEMLAEFDEKLKQLVLTESELLNSIGSSTEEKKQLEKEEESKQRDYENVKLASALSKLEIYKLYQGEAKANEDDINNILQQYRIDSESYLKEKEKELDDIKKLLVENKNIFDKLGNQIETIVSESVVLKNEIEKVEKDLAETEKEIINSQYKEEELNTFSNELCNIEKDIETCNEEFTKIGVEDNISLVELASDLNKVLLQIKEANTHYENQIETIKISFNNQEKTCKDKAAREIGEIENKSRKEEAHKKRVSLAVPYFNAEMKKIEKDLKNLLPDLSKKIQIGLDLLEELAKFYKHMLDSKNQKGKATTIRNLSSIEEQLASPMKCMMTLEYIPKINLNPPTSNGYQQILEVFREKYTETIGQLDMTQPLEIANKLQEMGSCLFGKKYVKPSINPQVLNETEISSSTEIYY